MAKLVEELMVIKVSQMVKDNTPAEELLPPDAVSSFEQVIIELVNKDNVMVEVTKEEAV
jgi:hypothetical protein|tara:strand:- start:74 stop:250 length:177 start_codon:yes stop_codon:yes gene_type:complete